MKALLEALEKDTRFKIDKAQSSVRKIPIDVHGNHQVHLHLVVCPEPAAILEINPTWFREEDTKKRHQAILKYWMDLITRAVKTHAPGAEPAWMFEESKEGPRITLGAVKTMNEQQTREFLAFARSKGLL